MRKFYLMYPNCQSVSDIFSWSHICLLMQATDDLERSFYEKECLAQKWDVRTLQRQMKSALYLRLAASKDKEGILTLASEGIQIQKPEDVVHDPLTLEFLNIPEELVGNEKAYNEAFNICGDEIPSFKEVLSVVEEYLGKKAVTVDLPVEFYAEQMPNRAGELRGGRAIDAINSNAKIKSVVPDFKHSISIKEGINKTLEVYKAQNYQLGIDWNFDGETDRIIALWCTKNKISSHQYKLGFEDYLGNATWRDKYQYMNARYHDKIWMKIARRIKRILLKI